jgi:hypothetical protein
VCQEKCDAIAATVDLIWALSCSEQSMKAYPARTGAHNAAIGQGEPVVNDAGLAWAGNAPSQTATQPPAFMQ